MMHIRKEVLHVSAKSRQDGRPNRSFAVAGHHADHGSRDDSRVVAKVAATVTAAEATAAKAGLVPANFPTLGTWGKFF